MNKQRRNRIAEALEMISQARDILEEVKDEPDLYNYLLPYSKGARCTFPGWKCTSPCVFGGKNAMARKI